MAESYYGEMANRTTARNGGIRTDPIMQAPEQEGASKLRAGIFVRVDSVLVDERSITTLCSPFPRWSLQSVDQIAAKWLSFSSRPRLFHIP